MNATLHILCLLVLGLSSIAAQDIKQEKITDLHGRRYFQSYDLNVTAMILRIMKEPSLGTRDVDDKSIYIRWTWLRTFHAPVCIRIAKKPGKPAELIATTLTGKSGYDWDRSTIHSRKMTSLSDRDWQKLQNWVSGEKFWITLTEYEQAMMMGTDGASWDFELSQPDRYELLSLQNPTGDPPIKRSFAPYVTLGRLLLKMGNMNIKDIDFY